MTLPASGVISFGSINTELTLSATATITLNDTAVRTLAAIPTSGAQISLSSFYGKTNTPTGPRVAVTYNYTLSSPNAAGVMNRTASGYVAGLSDVTFNVNPGVNLYSTSVTTAAFTFTGGAAGDTVIIVNQGVISGKGGNGANTASAPSAGGDAIDLSGLAAGISVTIDNTATNAYILGGGGGGASTSLAGGGGGAGGGNGGHSLNVAFFAGRALPGYLFSAIYPVNSSFNASPATQSSAITAYGGGCGGLYYTSPAPGYWSFNGGGGGWYFGLLHNITNNQLTAYAVATPVAQGAGGGSAAGSIGGSSVSPYDAGGGGGGYGAAGGNVWQGGTNSTGAAGGKAVNTGGHTVTFVSANTAGVYGAVA